MKNALIGFETAQRRNKTKEWWRNQSIFRRRTHCDRCNRTIKRPMGYLIEPGVTLSIGAKTLLGGPDLVCETCYTRYYFIRDLVSDLDHGDPSVRQNAAERLAEFGIDDGPSAADLGLADHAMILHGYDPATGEPFASLLTTGGAKERKEVLETITAWPVRDDRLVPPLLSCLIGGDPQIRAKAAEALGNMASFAAMGGLLGASRDVDPTVAKIAREALWKLRYMADHANEGDAIALALHFRDWNRLLRFGDSGIQTLIEAMKDPTLESYERERAADTLMQISSVQDASVLEPLFLALRDADKWVRQTAKVLIAKLRYHKNLQVRQAVEQARIKTS